MPKSVPHSDSIQVPGHGPRRPADKQMQHNPRVVTAVPSPRGEADEAQAMVDRAHIEASPAQRDLRDAGCGGAAQEPEQAEAQPGKLAAGSVQMAAVRMQDHYRSDKAAKQQPARSASGVRRHQNARQLPPNGVEVVDRDLIGVAESGDCSGAAPRGIRPGKHLGRRAP